MRALILRNIGGRNVLLLFILTNIVYACMMLITIPKVMKFSGGMKILDLMPTGYSSQYVNSLLGTLGDKGKDAYLYDQIPIDMGYPFLFAISSCLLLAYILNKLGKLDGWMFYLCLIPILSGFFDYCENIGIITMLNSFPRNSNLLTEVTSLLTVLKSIGTTVYFIILIFSLIGLGIKKWKRAGNDSFRISNDH
jgi:hypothetical protein